MSEQKKISPGDYISPVYSNKERWINYYYQTKGVQKLLPAGGSILEIGIGNTVVTNYLRANYTVTTVDTNKELNPDFVGSVEDLRFLNDVRFDLVLCAEVLEHLESAKLNTCLEQIKRVANSFVIISLPYWGHTFGCTIRLPMFGSKTIKFKINGYKRHVFNGQHYWEVGKKGYPVRMIKRLIEKCGLRIQKSFWDIDDPYHIYFILQK